MGIRLSEWLKSIWHGLTIIVRLILRFFFGLTKEKMQDQVNERELFLKLVFESLGRFSLCTILAVYGIYLIIYRAFLPFSSILLLLGIIVIGCAVFLLCQNVAHTIQSIVILKEKEGQRWIFVILAAIYMFSVIEIFPLTTSVNIKNASDFGVHHSQIESRLSTLSLQLPPSLVDAVKSKAKTKGISYNQYVRQLLEDDVSRP